MPVRRDKRTGKWQFQKLIRFPDGSSKRIFGRPTRNTRAEAETTERGRIDQVMKDWHARQYAPDGCQKAEVPTVSEFWPEFMETYVANNNKPSEADTKAIIYRVHIEPEFADTRLDDFGRRKVEAFKAKLRKKDLGHKRINNVLSVLGKLLSYAEEIELIDQAAAMHLLKVEPQKFRFLDFHEYEALLRAADEEPEWRLAVLLAGSAGLRLGEIMALQWSDREKSVKKMTIHQSIYKGELGATKGWNLRTIPLTPRLDVAFRECRHLRGKFVICNADGSAKKVTEMRAALPRLCKRAGLDPCSWHPLRHTFCSHLAMRGAPAKVIQELAGHSDLKTTLKYMHLASGAKEQAIGLLDLPAPCKRGANAE